MAKKKDEGLSSGEREKLRKKFEEKSKTALSKTKKGFFKRLFSKKDKVRKEMKKLDKLEKKKVLKEEKKEKKEGLVVKSRPKKEKKRKRLKHKDLLKRFLSKAGYYDADPRMVKVGVLRFSIIVAAVVSLLAVVVTLVYSGYFIDLLLFLVSIWTAVFGLVYLVSWLLLYMYLDIKIYRRTVEMEQVLPDFLQLASANISAGMPIDRALWFAIRPNFGVLAKDIEDVAKATLSGEDLKAALRSFASKYDSAVLMRSVNLLIEGMDAGGEMADLLSKVALNIQETQLMRREMAANVMTYVIFIGFATVVASPFLFALATQLLVVVKGIIAGLAASGSSDALTGGGLFSISFSGDSVSVSDFRLFSVVTLVLSSFFSGAIISVIRKGNIKEGLKFIPFFILVTLVIYFFASGLLGVLMSGLV